MIRTMKCLLEQAEKARSQSVVFPLVLKAGKKEFTVDKVAKYCYKGVHSFINNPYESLANVVLLASFSLHLRGQVVILVIKVLQS